VTWTATVSTMLGSAAWIEILTISEIGSNRALSNTVHSALVMLSFLLVSLVCCCLYEDAAPFIVVAVFRFIVHLVQDGCR